MKKLTNNPQSQSFIWLVVGILIFVGLLLAAMLYAHKSFSGKIKQLTFTLSNGPVSPEYQQTTRLILTSNSCHLTITTDSSKTSTSRVCPMDQTTFDKIQASTNNYGVVDKIIANDNSAGNIGGKEATISIELQNGTVFSTKMAQQFFNDLGPYFEEIELLVPSLSQVLPSQ